MTNKIILWVIKIFLIFFVMILMTIATKLMSLPILVRNIVGFAAILAIWNYRPSSQNDENAPQA